MHPAISESMAPPQRAGHNRRRASSLDSRDLASVIPNFDNSLKPESSFKEGDAHDVSSQSASATTIDERLAEVPTLLKPVPRQRSRHRSSKSLIDCDKIETSDIDDSSPKSSVKELGTRSLRSWAPLAIAPCLSTVMNSALVNRMAPPLSMAAIHSNRPQHSLEIPATPPLSAEASITSPCFYHSKFDTAVDLGRVLDEISEDDYSHSRLMQTATSVREVSKQLQRRPIKTPVRNVMIVTKARDNQLVAFTRELAEWLMKTPRYGSALGVNVYVDQKLQNAKRFDSQGLIAKDSHYKSMLRYWTPELCLNSPESFDLVLTLGGDGTVLYTSWLFQKVVPPVLSFSLGSLGFLTNFEFFSYRSDLSKILGDTGMRVNLRMRFTATVYCENKQADQFEVLNELVIDRGPSPYVSQLELYGDNELLTIIEADGCILSTPTGSTAYSLSAGGSLVFPDIPAILLTPICPHTLSFRPMLLNDTMLLKVAVPSSSRATAYCSFDGKGRVELKQGDYVTITVSQYPFPTVQYSPMEWFNSISRTLRWNTRGANQKGWPEDGNDDGAGEDWDIDTVDSGLGSEASFAMSPLRSQILGVAPSADEIHRN